MRHVLAGQRDGLAGLRVTALARRTEVQREAAEAADLDATALRQRVAHDLEDLLDRQLDVLGGQVLLLRCNELDEFRFGHARASSCCRRGCRLRAVGCSQIKKTSALLWRQPTAYS